MRRHAAAFIALGLVALLCGLPRHLLSLSLTFADSDLPPLNPVSARKEAVPQPGHIPRAVPNLSRGASEGTQVHSREGTDAAADPLPVPGNASTSSPHRPGGGSHAPPSSAPGDSAPRPSPPTAGPEVGGGAAAEGDRGGHSQSRFKGKLLRRKVPPLEEDPDMPPYCRVPYGNQHLFGCEDRAALKPERLLATGFQKTVWLVSHNGTRYVLKTSSREGGKERKHNSNLDPRSSRQGQIRREYRMARTLVVQYGFLPYTGYCSGKTSQDETWSLWPYLARGTFPILGSNVTHEGQVRMGIAAAKIFACMAHMPNNNYGYALDNSRKQYGVDEEYRVWVLDYDGFEVHDRGDKVEGGKKCFHDNNCRRGQFWDQVPEMRCIEAAGARVCQGLDSRSMAYVLGREFLSRLPMTQDASKSLMVEDAERRPNATSIVSLLEDRLERLRRGEDLPIMHERFQPPKHIVKA